LIICPDLPEIEIFVLFCLDISNDDDVKTVSNRCLFEYLINGGFMLRTSSCETRNALIIYLRHKLGDKCNLEMEEFEKHIKGKIEGYCST